MKKQRVLLVDDDLRVLRLVRQTLEEDYHVTSLSSGEAAIAALRANAFDLVITDLKMGKIDGIAVLREAKRLNPDTSVIMLTASAVEPLRLGADGYIPKPFSLTRLCKEVGSCLKGPVEGPGGRSFSVSGGRLSTVAHGTDR